MNRVVRAAFAVPFFAFVAGAGGLGTASCRGGGVLEGLDGSFDGQAVRFSAVGEVCAQAIVSIDDAAPDAAEACGKDDDCTVRIAGDYCACPNSPRPILASRAAAFDDSLEGLTKKCTCQIAPCEPLRPSRAVCHAGRCALAD